MLCYGVVSFVKVTLEEGKITERKVREASSALYIKQDEEDSWFGLR